MTAAGLLRHFESKEHLLIAVLERWDDESAQLIQRISVGLKWFQQYCPLMTYHEEHPGFIELYLTLAGEASDPNPLLDRDNPRYQQLIDEGHS